MMTDALQEALDRGITEITPNSRELLRQRYLERSICSEGAPLLGRKMEAVDQALARLQ